MSAGLAAVTSTSATTAVLTSTTVMDVYSTNLITQFDLHSTADASSLPLSVTTATARILYYYPSGSNKVSFSNLIYWIPALWALRSAVLMAV